MIELIVIVYNANSLCFSRIKGNMITTISASAHSYNVERGSVFNLPQRDSIARRKTGYLS
jgi:hypothetical protein